MVACTQGDFDAVKLFVSNGGVDLLRHRNDDGETALHVACAQGAVPVSRLVCSCMS